MSQNLREEELMKYSFFLCWLAQTTRQADEKQCMQTFTAGVDDLLLKFVV